MSNWMKTFMGEQVAAPYITTMQNLLGSILFTLVVAGFMLVIYRVCHDTLTYNKKFNITLMMLAVISTVLLALIQNNPLLSLGVLGPVYLQNPNEYQRSQGLRICFLGIGNRYCVCSRSVYRWDCQFADYGSCTGRIP